MRSFPNAKIYVNAEEIGADELKDIPNIVPVEFTDGAYYNFPESQKIADVHAASKGKRNSIKHNT